MKLSQLRWMLALLLFSLPTASRVLADSYEQELEAILERAKAKAQNGQTSESDLARELNQLSDLQNKYRSQKAIAAQILLTRAIIYDQVIKDREMALILYTQVATEYPGTDAGFLAAMTVEAAIATADDRPAPRNRGSNQKQEQNRSGGGGNSAAASGSSSSSRSRNATTASRSGSSSVSRNARAASNAQSARSGPAPEVGDRFPDFNLQDADGVPLTLADLRGQMVLIDFWATSCSECIEEMDNVMAAYRRFHRQGFEIVGINLDRDRAPMKNFVRARTITWPQYFDEGGTFSRRHGVSAPGSSFLLDREGKVIAVNLRGYALERMLQKHLEP